MFVNEHSEEIDLPNPQILELHAAFSRVHLTGAGECLESYWRDMDEIRILASDGSTHLDFLRVFRVGQICKSYDIACDILIHV